MYLQCLISIAIFALIGWGISVATRHYSHVDSMWSLFMALAGVTTALNVVALSPRAILVLCLVIIWAVRLSGFITWRNWGKEDYRYETIRQNNEPHFWLKSLYIVFGLQAVLAWLVAYPVYAATASLNAWQWLDVLASVLFLLGFYWEVVADWQLHRFKSNPANQQAVLNTGLWRYSRHPNYFGECLIWWGFALFGVASGSHWSWFSPVLMTLLLLKVSGVSLLEQTITSRRPGYAEYIATTNAFIPGFPKKNSTQ